MKEQQLPLQPNFINSRKQKRQTQKWSIIIRNQPVYYNRRCQIEDFIHKSANICVFFCKIEGKLLSLQKIYKYTT